MASAGASASLEKGPNETNAAMWHSGGCPDAPMTNDRSFEIQARLRAADGKWPLLPGTHPLSASSLDELQSALAGHFDSGVRIVSVKDEDEDEWVAVTSLADIPNTAKLRLKAAPACIAPPHSLHYGPAAFKVGVEGSIEPVAKDQVGATIPASGAGVFQVRAAWTCALTCV